jgi:hypothetical protein
MPDTGRVAPAVTRWYAFADGRCAPADPPDSFDGQAGDVAAELCHLEYTAVLAAGDRGEVSYDVFERPAAGGGWVVIIAVGRHRIGVRVGELLDLLELLTRLAPLTVAGCVRQGSQVGSFFAVGQASGPKRPPG